VEGARFRLSGVTIADEFGSIVVDIKRPRRLCVPAVKNDEGPLVDAVSHLMCYEVRLAATSPFTPAGTIFVNNQFGDDQFGGFRTRELCVPSLKNPISAATPTPTPTPTVTPTETPTPSPSPSPGCGLVAGGPACGGDCEAGLVCAFAVSSCTCVPRATLCGSQVNIVADIGTCAGFCLNQGEVCGSLIRAVSSGCECLVGTN
jgi:hypothetical protein